MVHILRDLDSDITGKYVIIVEDIIDSGLTLNHLKKLLATRNPASIAICTAFDKPDRRQVNVHIDYAGIVIPDEFIVGYGLDYNGNYRHLADVCILGDDGGDNNEKTRSFQRTFILCNHAGRDFFAVFFGDTEQHKETGNGFLCHFPD